MIAPKKYCPFCRTLLMLRHIEGRDRLFCTDCDAPIYENPTPAACVTLIDPHNRLLLVKRNVEPKIGFWCLPGGFMELDETPEQAALRELKEETGLTGKIDRLLGVSSHGSDRYGTILMVGYLVTNYAGTPVPGDDAEDIAFFIQADLPEIAFKSHKEFIGMYYASLAAKA